MLQHGCGALHDVWHGGHDEPPPGDELQRVREARGEAEVDVLHQDLLEDLHRYKRWILKRKTITNPFFVFLDANSKCQTATAQGRKVVHIRKIRFSATATGDRRKNYIKRRKRR